jgi:hypothetical protein
LLFVQYDGSGLEEVLKGVFDPKWTLGTLPSDKSVIVTTFQLDSRDEGWRPAVLHNLTTGDKEEDRVGQKTNVIDAALCTSAAPLYFPPHKHPDLGYCADGGLFANNPGAAAVVTARRAERNLEDIRLLSIGTGSTVNHMKVPPWNDAEGTGGTRCGIMAWLLPFSHSGVPSFPLIAALFDSAAAADAMFCKGVLRDRYHRVQVRLEREIPLDAAGEKDLESLDEVADTYFKTARWAEDKRWIINNFLAT